MPDFLRHAEIPELIARVSVLFRVERLPIGSRRHQYQSGERQDQPDVREELLYAEFLHVVVRLSRYCLRPVSYCRFKPKMLRKKLARIVCKPSIMRVTAGITSRNVCEGLSGPYC